MADRLVFPIGFDLEAAVKEAQGNAPRLLRRLQTTINSKPLAVNLKIDDAGSGSIKEINARLKTIVKEWNNLTEAQRITNKTTGEYTAEAKKLLAEYTRLIGATNSYARTLKQIDSEAKKAAKAQEKLAERANKASQEFKNQEGYVSRLVKRLAVYAGFSAVSGFLTSVREVTAEFELQRVSLGAIIQDQQRANKIFAEIKSFALTSPLKILDLTKYTKQVAAYGIETEKLFGTTKMLADISVGLGVSLDRLALFYGQVYATGYLRASEVRQATEAGIPLVDKLAKKLSEANGKLVSAAEVMDLISKRAISFEQVEEVFKDMTSAGGEFYNMQIKQSQTLFGMWSKLGDAAALMYDQIGNTSEVNSAMRTTISLLEKMMRNWQTTGTILGSLAVGMGTYALALKNASVASTALSLSEAQRLVVEKGHLVTTPKVVAAIIGKGRAFDLSIKLTNLYTAAMARGTAATNVFTKAFWKLTAAILANPWAIALAAIVAAGYAVYQFSTRVETAADRTEKLNNSVASLKNLDDTVKPLIDTYNELIDKTERTTEEEKKLSEVTHELAKRYPGAITAVGNFGAEVDLATDKLNKLYQTEKNARMENTRYELGKTEKKISETEEKIAQLQQALQKGTKTITVGGGTSGYVQTVTVQMSDEDKGKILQQIDELRGGLGELKDAAEAAEAAIKGITVEQFQIEKFGAWKKTFSNFGKFIETEVTDKFSRIRDIKLFDDSTINQFTSLEDALKTTAKKYKENIALVKVYDDVLKSTSLTAEERAKIEVDRAEADAMATLAKKALDYYNTLPTAFDKGGKRSDPRLQNLKEEISLVQKLYQEYKQLEKQEGATSAAADMERMAGGSIKALSDKYGIALPKTAKDVTSALEILYKKMAQLPRKVFPTLDKDLRELRWTIEKVDIDDAQKKIEQQLKALSDKISRTKTAKEFYDKILSQTGDLDLAMNVTMSVYGDTGEGLFDNLVEQIRKSFTSGDAGIDLQITAGIDAAIDTTNQRINYEKLAEVYEKYQNDIIEENRSTVENIIKEGQKTAAANILTWEKELAKAKDYEEQRTDIINRETQRRAEIYKSNLPQEEKDRLAAQSRKKQDEDVAKLNFEEFTKSEDYIKIFENLDNTSTAALKRLREEMHKLIETNKDLSPENMKTLVKAMEDIDEQISGRGFGNDMVQGVRDYIDAFRDLKTARTELQTAQAEYDAELPQLDADIKAAKNEEIAAQKELDTLKAQELKDENAIVAAKLRLNNATTAVTNAEQAKAKAAEKVGKAEAKVTNQTDKQKKATSKFFKDLQQVAQTAGQLASVLGDVQELLGVSADSAAGVAFDSAIQGLQEFSKIMNVIIGLQTLYNIVTSSNPWIAIAAAVLAVGTMLGSWISNNKVRKANKEIERQQELLDQLEYAYKRVQKAADKLFGHDYIHNFDQQEKLLRAQAEAYRKQAEAERSKGKKADEAKIKEYENAYRDALDEIADMQGQLAEKFTGKSSTDAARQFVESWFDAKIKFANTKDAIMSDYKDLIKNMVIEGAAAKVIDNILSPMWEQMDEQLKQNDITGAIDYLVSGMDTFVKQADDSLNVLWQSLKNRGYDMQKILGDTDSGLTGIAKNVASASSEEINANTAALNVQNYYASHLPAIAMNVEAIRASMEKGMTSSVAATNAGWTDWQTQAMQHYAAIQKNTADTVVVCTRIAEKCTAMAEDIHRVVKPRGATGTHGIQVWT